LRAALRKDAAALTVNVPLKKEPMAAAVRRRAEPPGPFVHGIQVSDHLRSRVQVSAGVACALFLEAGLMRAGGPDWPEQRTGIPAP
jgi:hypothetical protein